MANEGKQAANVPAMAMREEAEAFARAFHTAADADMIERAEAQFVHGKAPAADVAGDFAERVVCHRAAGADAEDADAVARRRPDQADRFLRRVDVGHAAFMGGGDGPRTVDSILRRPLPALLARDGLVSPAGAGRHSGV